MARGHEGYDWKKCKRCKCTGKIEVKCPDCKGKGTIKLYDALTKEERDKLREIWRKEYV